MSQIIVHNHPNNTHCTDESDLLTASFHILFNSLVTAIQPLDFV